MSPHDPLDADERLAKAAEYRNDCADACHTPPIAVSFHPAVIRSGLRCVHV
jgi:hypothetical protein